MSEKFSDTEAFQLNPSDFESIRVEFKAENLTTNMPIQDNGKFQLLEILDQTLIISIPEKSCSQGHHLEVLMRVSNQGKPVEFKTTAVVEGFETGEEKVDRVTLKLLQYDKGSWTSFMKVFNKRQNEIENFFSAVKGYD